MCCAVSFLVPFASRVEAIECGFLEVFLSVSLMSIAPVQAVQPARRTRVTFTRSVPTGRWRTPRPSRRATGVTPQRSDFDASWGF